MDRASQGCPISGPLWCSLGMGQMPHAWAGGWVGSLVLLFQLCMLHSQSPPPSPHIMPSMQASWLPPPPSGHADFPLAVQAAWFPLDVHMQCKQPSTLPCHTGTIAPFHFATCPQKQGQEVEARRERGTQITWPLWQDQVGGNGSWA